MDTDKDGFLILERKYSPLWEKVNYLAPILKCTNRVYEYDITMANVSVLRAQKALPEKILKKLEDSPKQIRNVTVGKMIQVDKILGKKITKGILAAKHQLFIYNNIQDGEVLTIKNDAVFVIGRKLNKLEFGPVKFVLKNSFSMYHKVEKLELYYDKPKSKIIVKGMRDDILEEDDHINGMCEFLRTVFNHIIYDRRDKLRAYLLEFTDAYKSRKLPYQYYREMNGDNVYRLATELSGYTFNLTAINQKQVGELNINYNYLYYVLPLIQLYI